MKGVLNNKLVGNWIGYIALLYAVLFSISLSASTIRGKVLNNDTHLPVVGATVFCPFSGSSVLTNQRGEFVLNHETDSIQLLAEGFVPLVSMLGDSIGSRTFYLEKIHDYIPAASGNIHTSELLRLFYGRFSKAKGYFDTDSLSYRVLVMDSSANCSSRVMQDGLRLSYVRKYMKNFLEGFDIHSLCEKEFYGKVSPFTPTGLKFYHYSIDYIYNAGGRRICKMLITPKREDDRLVTATLQLDVDTGNPLFAYLYFNDGIANYQLKLTFGYLSKGLLLPLSLVVSSGKKNREIAYAGVVNYDFNAKDNALCKSATKQDDAYLEHLMNNTFVGKMTNYCFIEPVVALDKQKNWTLTLPSIVSFIGESNFVDGYWLGACLKLHKKMIGNRWLDIRPQIYYATNRKVFLGRLDVSLFYSPKHKGSIALGIGRITSDYNDENGESRFLNGLFSSFFAQNYVKLYQRDFVQLSYRTDVKKSLQFDATLSYEHRMPMTNHVHHSWFGKTASPNIPLNVDYHQMPTHNFVGFQTNITYVPKGDRSELLPANSWIPTFGLSYKLSYPFLKNNEDNAVHRVDFNISNDLTLGFFNHLIFHLNVGTFLHRSPMLFPEFKHFAASPLDVRARSFDDGLFLPNNYILSTNKAWFNGNLSWHTPYMMLKFIPVLRGLPFDEALHYAWVVSKSHPSYWEMGYSIGVNNDFRVGCFLGYRGRQYESFGFKISMGYINHFFP